MRTNSIALIAAVILLAGCTNGSSGASQEESTDPDAPREARYDAETGGVKGLVTDDQFQPIPGATVRLDGVGETQSRPDGTFVFDHVPPGRYDVVATAEGHLPARETIAVEAASLTEIGLTLTPQASESAFHETVSQRGHVLCSVAFRVAVVQPESSGQGLCNPLGTLATNQCCLVWPLETFDNVTGVWGETTWQSTQSFGNGLETVWILGGPDHYDTFHVVAGEAPLTAPFARSMFENHTTERWDTDLSVCSDGECALDSWHFAYASHLGESSPADIGITLQQSYEDYLTIFHREPFPTQFTALADE